MVMQSLARRPLDAYLLEEAKASLRSYDFKSDLGRFASLAVALSGAAADLSRELLARIGEVVVFESSLAVAVVRAGHGSPIEDYGIVSRRVITTAGATYLAQAFAASGGRLASDFKYHAIGTGGGTPEAIGDTALVAEISAYQTPSTRATGTASNPVAGTYQSVGANIVTSALTINEHGLLTQAATGGGVLWDRSVFTGIALQSGDQLQTTYSLIISSGG